MSLSAVYDIARGSLAANSTISSVVARNVANVDDPNASRKTARVVSDLLSGVGVEGVSSAVSSALFDRMLDGSSRASELGTVSDALDRLEAAIGAPGSETGPAAGLARLQSALQAAAAAPQDQSLAGAAVSAAKALAGSIRQAGDDIAEVRRQADGGLSDAVGQLNMLLAGFTDLNSAIVGGTANGRDVSDQVDRRNGMLRQISDLIGVRAIVRANDDMVLFTGNGTTLFERTPRTVSLDSAGQVPDGAAGAAVHIDGVPFDGTGGGGLGGKIGGLLEVRDGQGLTAGRQLDELARGLIAAFAESDQAGTSKPDLPGLFTYSGATSLPPSGTALDGLARRIAVNANVDPEQGGNLALLRDGGISSPSDPSYSYNQSGASAFGDRLRGLVRQLSADQPFDPRAGIAGTASVLGCAAAGIGWLETARSTTSVQADDAKTKSDRAASAWQSRVGVNLDQELTDLMSLQRSYQASSRLITTVNSMFDALLQASR